MLRTRALALSTFLLAFSWFLSRFVFNINPASSSFLVALAVMQVWPSKNPWACVATGPCLTRSERTDESFSSYGILDFLELAMFL